MITITSYLHRKLLRDLIRRWMHGEARPSDGEEIVRLVHFNNAYVARYLTAFSEAVFGRLHPDSLEARRARRKADLKDLIVENLENPSPRTVQLLKNYREFPEFYYRETPFHGNLYFSREPRAVYLGSNRIKRVRRLAEKCARRIIDWMFIAIKRKAEALAEERARLLGIARQQMITTPEGMIEEFLRAESRLLEDLKHGVPMPDADGLVIQDVAGVKVIVENADRDRFLEMVASIPGCELVEIEPHSGVYNAVNLIVRLQPDRQRLLAQPLGEQLLAVMGSRGIDAADAARQFRNFVLSGERTVNLEVILSSYEEMLESEIGRCMHEERINRQRQEQQYNGQLARNIEYLMVYLFAFPASRQTVLEELPVKLWYRYLPDYFDEVLKKLFEVPSVEVLE
jgi:hypothetical protein